ncbi:photoreceptor cilium actin regulator [Oncorhynchus keta]|uniref:photoreceptor cilium actin regulator n=1 Tax=Oncorhynchus keta TaxID=8018 RepID=UPI0015FBECB6|nr:photoreceptor cilium actin regulator [Oncorhynchus keta]
MGCSPSKGNNFVAHGTFGRGRTLQPGGKESIVESQSDCGGSGGSSGTGDTWERRDGERRLAGQTQSVQKEAPSTPQKRRPSLTELVPEGVILDKKVGTQETDKTGQHGKEKQGDKQDMADKKGGRKPKKNCKGVKSAKKKEKENKAPLVEQKVDFPEPLVKAHQAAYAFLNPSISKYEILLGLLDQATQTQMSVQPMVTFMAMRYDEINRGLEEMADEGERLLKDNGEHLAWPSPMKNLSSSPPLKSGSINAEPPPDLLQQLLQYTTQRMQNVGQSVGGIGDSALEEAAEYFTSVSELLEDKLKAKHAAETRLMQLLTRIEAASLRKPGPEDSGLFSEDSGIGAESESLAGSERRLRCESCESTGSNRTTPYSPFGINASPVQQGAPRQKFIKKVSHSNSLNSIDSVCTIMDKGSASLDNGEEQGDDDEGEEEGQGGRTRSNASLSGPNQQPCRLVPKRIENPQNVEMTLKMKDAISGRIRFVPSQRDSAKTKPTDSPKTRCQWTEGGSPKRPQRAASVRREIKKTTVPKEHRSQSAESVRSKGEDPTLIELERTQKDLSQMLERMSKGRTEGNTKAGLTKQNPGDSATSPASNRLCPTLQRNNNILPIQDIAGLMKHDSGEHRAGKDIEEKNKDKKSTKGPLKATPPPSPTLGPLKATPPPSPSLSHRPCSGLFRGRNSVKRLIDSFSQGVEEPKQEASKGLGPLKGVRKCGVHVMPGVGDTEAIMNSGVSSCRTYDLDLESLPPPPLEVLMDNSFEGAQSLTVSDVDDGIASRGRSPVPKRATASQKMRASMRSVSVLPSRGNLPQGSSSMFPARTVRRDISASSRVSNDEPQLEVDPETEEAATLYKQARKIIHLRHSSESPIEKGHSVPKRSSPNRAASGGRQGDDSPSETVPPTSTISSQPPATPPVSRIRMLPSTPSTPSGLHRRLPSPITFRKQPTPPSTNSPPAIRKLPTPPPLQRRLPSPPASRKVLTPNSSSSDSTHSFKAPSPPTSPRVQRWKRENSSKDSSPGASAISQLISNARSVFCPASSSLFEAQPCPVPCPPQAWASISGSVVPLSWGNRGRLPTSVRGPKPFIRRSHSDRRPSLSLPSRAPIVSFAETCGSEPAISIHGLEDELSREDESWDSKSDFRGNAHSASHPDLCIVGQGLTL